MKTETRQPTAAVPDELERIKEAFELFDNRSRILQASFEQLQNELAQANRDLNSKNLALSQKVTELEDLSSRFRCILESLTDGVLVVGLRQEIEHCNPAAEQLLGISRAMIEGKGYAEVTRDLGNAEAIRRAIDRGQTIRDQQRIFINGRNKRVDVLANVGPIRSLDGSVLGAVEVWRDVTDFRALEAQVRHQERMAALGEMAASVAHEIRNPLGTIEGFARLLRRDLDDQPPHRRLADKIVEGAQNLNYVITNLLTYVRPMSLQVETFEINKLLSTIQDSLAGAAAGRRVVLEVAMADPSWNLKGDIRQLRQVIVNLGMNGIEACQGEGHVRIGVERREWDLVLRVMDDGSGIDPEHLQRIFDPFFTTKQGGTGLGLSLCHKIVTAHNGRIEVISKPGQGTTFEVVLPYHGGES